MATLSLRGIHKSYAANAPVLEGIDLDVAAGELVVIVGPSGCGKSTLLRIVAGLIQPSAGEVWIDDRCVTDRRPGERDVAMVFQNYALYPHMTVARNLAFPLRNARLPRARIAERVAAAARSLGLEGLLDRKPSQLSGGQMQRVAVGRAIVREPKVFLFDEPLSNLDTKLRGELRTELAELHRRLAITTLYVTHDQAEAMTLGSRIVVLHEGRVQQIGAPLDVFARPATRFVAGFIGSPPMNLIEGVAEGGVFHCGPLALAGAPAEGPLVLGVRPEHVRVVSRGGTGFAVRAVEAHGNRTLVNAESGAARLRLCLGGEVRVKVGERLAVEIPQDRLHWFGGGSGLRLESG